MSMIFFGYGSPVEGGSWEDDYQIVQADADNLGSVHGFANVNPRTNVSRVYLTAVYIGSGAIDTSKYQNFPIHTQIIDTQANEILLKTGASGVDSWVSVALT